MQEAQNGRRTNGGGNSALTQGSGKTPPLEPEGGHSGEKLMEAMKKLEEDL